MGSKDNTGLGVYVSVKHLWSTYPVWPVLVWQRYSSYNSSLDVPRETIPHHVSQSSTVKLPLKKTHIVSRAIFLLSAAVYFALDSFLSCLGPLGLNKVITFKVLCRSLQIELTRHPDSTIEDPNHVAGSYKMGDVCRLSAHVVKLRDIPEGVLVLFGLSHVWKSQTCDPVLRDTDGNVIGIHDFQYLPEWTDSEVQEDPYHDVRPTIQWLLFYCTLFAAIGAAVPNLTLEELAVSNPSAKVIAKAEASQKRKSSNFGYALSHVTKRTRVEALLPPPLKPKYPRKGIMTDTDAAAAPSVGASLLRVSSGYAPSFRELFGDAIHRDFFPFSSGPCYATCPEGGIAVNYEFTCKEWDAPHQPTLKVLTKKVFKDPSVCKTVVDQFPTPEEIVRIEALSFDQLTRLTGLNDKLFTSDASFTKSKANRKEKKKKIKSLTKSLDNFHAEVACLFSDLNWATVLEAKKDEEILRLKTTPPAVRAELLSLAASAGFERGLSMHQTKEEFAGILKKISQFLEPKKLARLANVSTLRDACVSPSIAKESTVTLSSTSLEFLSNTVPTSSVATLEPNVEWVNAMVDGLDKEMVDGAANTKPENTAYPCLHSPKTTKETRSNKPYPEEGNTLFSSYMGIKYSGSFFIIAAPSSRIPFFWQWEHPPLAVGTYTASGNSLLAVG
nr:hypothetical protein [Tanacetum cinerariifolium]